MSKEVFDALGQVASYALSVDDSIRGDCKFPTKGGLTHGLAFERNNHQYDIRAPASKQYFSVDYRLRLTEEFEDYLWSNPNEVDSILRDHDVTLDEGPQEDRVQAAAKFHVATIPEEDVQAVTEEITSENETARRTDGNVTTLEGNQSFL